MKERFLLIKYYLEYIRFDKLTYKLLSLPASEQDADLLEEYIQTKDMYAGFIRELREKRAAAHTLRPAVAYVLAFIILLLAGTGIAEAAGFHIWREVFTIGTKHVVINGTDDAQGAEGAEVVRVDDDENAVTYTYDTPSQANAALGVDTGLGDVFAGEYMPEAVKVTYIDDIAFTDVTYKNSDTFYAVRVTVIRGDSDFMSGISIDSDTYEEREIAGVICSVNTSGGYTSCTFVTTASDVKLIYSVRTNAEVSGLDSFVAYLLRAVAE